MIITGNEVRQFINIYPFRYYGHYLRAVRQIDMLRRVTEGKDIKQIATDYSISHKAVYQQINYLFEKIMFHLGYGKSYEDYLDELSKLTDEEILRMVISNSHKAEFMRLARHLDWEVECKQPV